jgi:gamma-glutamylcyclotransferase (GGCT)/AIG2-like uncharacterized protein YtfP
MIMQRLFVYGTLGPGRPNEHLMTRIGGDWSPASVRGHLYEEGWGALEGYPGIVIDPAGEEVKGFLFTSDNFDAHWDALDEFEGEEYQRILIDVSTEDGQTVKAFVYAIRKPNQAV